MVGAPNSLLVWNERRSQVVLSLEGGYDLPAMCDCAQECVRALLGERPAAPAHHELARQPAPPAQDVLRTTMAIQAHHWPSVSVGRSARPIVAASRPN